MSKLETRISKLEALTAPARGPRIIMHFEGETDAETLARYGLPADYRASVWLPAVKRTIGGIDLEHDI